MYFKDQTYSLGLSLSLHPEPAIPPRYTVMHAHIHNTPAPASAPTSSEFPHAPMSPFLHQQPANGSQEGPKRAFCRVIFLLASYLDPTAKERLG